MKWKLYRRQEGRLESVTDGDEFRALRENANRLAEKAGFWDHVWVYDPDGTSTTYELHNDDNPQKLFVIQNS